MTTILGNNSNPTGSWDETTNWNQVASGSGDNVTVPTGGMMVSKLWFYFGSNANYRLSLHDASDNSIIVSSASTSSGTNRQWRSATVTPTYVAAGTQVYVSVWVASGTDLQFNIRGSGSWRGRSGLGSPSTMAGATTNPTNGSFVYGNCAWYLEYNPAGGLGYASGGTYHKYGLKRYDAGSSTWKRHPLKRWNNSTGQWEWLA